MLLELVDRQRGGLYLGFARDDQGKFAFGRCRGEMGDRVGQGAAPDLFEMFGEFAGDSDPTMVFEGTLQVLQSSQQAVRSFVQNEGARFVGEASDVFTAIAPLGRQKPLKHKRLWRQSRNAERGNSCRRPRNRHHRNTFRRAGFHQFKPRIRNAWHPRVADECQILSALEMGDQLWQPFVPVVGVVAGLRRLNLEVVQQFARVAGVFGGDQINLFEGVDGPKGHVGQVADGRADDVECTAAVEICHNCDVLRAVLQNKPSCSWVEEKRVQTGVFVGLITLDCIYQTQHALQPNEKQVAENVLLAAGGPATNAAIAFSALGGHARLVGVLGQHPLAAVVRDDLAAQGVELVDLMPTATVPPPFSSIVVNAATGDRAVISRNAADRPMPQALPDQDILTDADCLLIDGHQMVVSELLAQSARQRQIPTVVDGGSWKAGFERVLPLATTVIASANFSPPNGGTEQAAIAYLRSLNIPCVAVTRGDRPILYTTEAHAGELAVPSIQPVDTLGAGDIFHGAFCAVDHCETDFLAGLKGAAQVAALACQSFGTRQWIAQLPRQPG